MTEETKPTEIPVGHDIVMPETPSEDPQVAAERSAFTRYVKEQGEKIPANFKSAEEWFNSLKTAQAQYTKTRQEIAELKKTYNETAVSNPNYDPQAERQPQPTAEPVLEDVSNIPNELNITKPVEPPTPTGVTQDDWTRWGREIDKNGDLSEATKKEIAKRIQADPVVVEQMVRGRKAMQKQAFDQSAEAVGGADNLKRILKWAGENLSKDEIESINRGLQTAASKSILLGLQSRYQQTQPAPQETRTEPRVSNPNATSSKPSQPSISSQAFVSEYEMKAAIADPRYRTDNNFRRAVEARIFITHQHGYKSK